MSKMLSQGKGVPEMTPLHHANHEIKKRFVDALFAKDWDTVRELCHPDIVLREPKALPYGGDYKGYEGFRECWDKIPVAGHKAESLDTLRTFFSEDPNTIIVELDFKGTMTSTGERVDSIVLEQFDFKDGKVIAILVYWFDIPNYH
jgi:ketosteroid isomerase-like protein